MDLSKQDIFDRLRQSYLLQIKLIRLHPWIFEFSKLSTETKSNEINEELKNRRNKKQVSCNMQLFDMVDETKFRKGFDIGKCKKFILWANIGFTNEILDDIRNNSHEDINCETILQTIDEYFDELKKIFYTSANE